jgi:hypothetical protein
MFISDLYMKDLSDKELMELISETSWRLINIQNGLDDCIHTVEVALNDVKRRLSTKL